MEMSVFVCYKNGQKVIYQTYYPGVLIKGQVVIYDNIFT